MPRGTKWLIKDNEMGRLYRFVCHSSDPEEALKAYLYTVDPNLTPREVEHIAEDFNGEIWAERDIVNLDDLNDSGLRRLRR